MKKSTSYESIGPWKMAFQRFKKNKSALLGAIVLILIILFTYVGPHVFHIDLDTMDITRRLQEPSRNHWFGTDRHGRDVFSRIIVGGRITLALAALSSTVTLLTGTLIGLLAGYFGKWVDHLLMRFTEFVQVMPIIPMMIAFTAVFAFDVSTEMRMVYTMLLYGFLNFPTTARMVRGQVLMYKDAEFMVAADLLGISRFTRLFKHLLPNIFGIIVASATSITANAIIVEITFSFIGLGFPSRTPTWGNMVPNIRGTNIVTQGYHWLWVYSISLISLTIISVNLLGEGLRDALDPKGEGR